MAFNTSLPAPENKTTTTTATTINDAVNLQKPEQVVPKPRKSNMHAAGYSSPKLIPGMSLDVTITPQEPAVKPQEVVDQNANTIPNKKKKKKKKKKKRKRNNKKKEKKGDNHSGSKTFYGPACPQHELEPHLCLLSAHGSSDIVIESDLKLEQGPNASNTSNEDQLSKSLERTEISDASNTSIEEPFAATLEIETHPIPDTPSVTSTALDTLKPGTSRIAPLMGGGSTQVTLEHDTNTCTLVMSEEDALEQAMRELLEQSPAREKATARSNGGKLYLIKDVAGKGKGMFATNDMARGTRILSEAPIFVMPKEVERYEVFRRILDLSPSAQTAYLSLANPVNPDRDDRLADYIMMLNRRHPSVVPYLPVKILVKIMVILETNSFGISNPSTQDIDQSAIVLDASRMNHSCIPNVYFCWNHGINMLTVHAIRKIAAGEEISASYVNICAYKQHRHESLKRYCFMCKCQACDLATDLGRTSEKNRKRLCAVNRELVMSRLYPDSSKNSLDSLKKNAGRKAKKALQKGMAVRM